MRKFSKEINEKKITKIHCIDPVDNWLEKRVREMSRSCKLIFYENPAFLNKKEELSTFFKGNKKSFFKLLFTNNSERIEEFFWIRIKSQKVEVGPMTPRIERNILKEKLHLQ
ncbi:cryptochrome/photolyase family protein [Algoriphagus halophilus]|uniref:cryptochrome/photolyase family protein n=1 Tax=Algoriphagus halophilus TaxID=226505 RepID=UPI00358E71DC